MYVKDKMTSEPICISGDAKISEVVDIMSEHHLHRVPVVNNGKLVGLVTGSLISQKGPTKATSLSIFELNYLLSKTSVDTIMIRDVITINENRFLEDAALLMLNHDIGCLPVLNDQNELVGIMTQNDVFAAFLDVLGYREHGSRICIEVKDKIGAIGEISEVFVRNKINISHVGVYSLKNEMAEIIFRVETIQTDALEKDLIESGYKVLNVSKNPN
ncbi:MAG: CBS and ACT domain-containing protein [Erysipelotrichaceae bacterium]